MAHGTRGLSARPGIRNFPLVTRLVSDSRGAFSLRLSKLLNQENALGAPWLDTVSLALRTGTLAGSPMRPVQRLQSRQGKTALTVESYFQISTVFGRHQERL